MKIYSVLPLHRGPTKNTLSYFGPDNIENGSLVTIPLRNKQIHALVIDSSPLNEVKSEVRKSPFALKKILSVKKNSSIDKYFLEAATETSYYFASQLSGVLYHLFPKVVLENINGTKHVTKKNKGAVKIAKYAIQTDDEERVAHYKSLVREEFAKGNTIYFCLPSIEEVKRIKSELERGIENYVFSLHSDVSSKDFRKTMKNVADTKHPLLLIGTPPFISSVSEIIDVVVLEKENSRGYRTLSRPLIDLKKFVYKFAEKKGLKLVVGDSILSVDTYQKVKRDEFLELSPIKSRITTSAECKIVDMKKGDTSYDGEFRVLSDELISVLENAKETSASTFIYASRKGISPITVCGDCGKLLTCTECGAALVLHQGRDEKRIYICHKCGAKRDPLARCSNCSSWKLTSLGIGIERVKEEIKKRFPDREIHELSKDKAANIKKAEEIIEKFENSPGSILLGTELALLYINSPLPFTAVASIDSMLSIPEFKINERIFQILTKMRALSTNTFIIQTRNSENKIFEKAINGNITDFFKEELLEREKFSYPPYSTFIRISITGKKASALKEMEKVESLFKDYDFSVFTGLHPGTTLKYTVNGLLRIKGGDDVSWPDEKILKLLLSLPPQFEIQVDPENLF